MTRREIYVDEATMVGLTNINNVHDSLNDIINLPQDNLVVIFNLDIKNSQNPQKANFIFQF